MLWTKKLLTKGDDKLKYTVCGYSTVTFDDGGSTASSIIVLARAILF